MTNGCTMAKITSEAFRLACALAIVLTTFQGAIADEPEKLKGGTETDIDHHPYSASLRMYGQHMCGGAIITSRHILTAAHCLQPFANDPYAVSKISVVTGTSSLLYGGEEHKIKRLHYHRKYNPNNNQGHDVGIVELKEPIKFNSRQKPIDLPTSDVTIKAPVVIASWGTVDYPKGELSNTLQQVVVTTMGPTECQRYHGTHISGTEFCTLLRQGVGACPGDSGSPVTNNGKVVVGVVSAGIPCGLGYPDIHTNIYKVLDYIHEIISS